MSEWLRANLERTVDERPHAELARVYDALPRRRPRAPQGAAMTTREHLRILEMVACTLREVVSDLAVCAETDMLAHARVLAEDIDDKIAKLEADREQEMLDAAIDEARGK